MTPAPMMRSRSLDTFSPRDMSMRVACSASAVPQTGQSSP